MKFNTGSKYKSKKATFGGHTFDSQIELNYYKQLLLRLKAGEIESIELQPKVYLTSALILYKPDFLIIEQGVQVWIDVKGFKTPVFAIKKRLWKHYGPGLLWIVYKNKVDIVKVISPMKRKEGLNILF